MPDLSILSTRVGDIMTKNVVVAHVDEPVIKAVDRMVEKRVECLPVVDDERRLRGLITFRDVVVKVVYGRKDPSDAKVSEIMSTDVVTCTPDTTLLELIKLMKSRGIRRVPVVDDRGRLVGIVTDFDIAIFGLTVK